MVMSGRSVNLTTTLFLGRHILSPVTDNCPSSVSGRSNDSMWPDRVSNPGPLAIESDALPSALRIPATKRKGPYNESSSKAQVDWSNKLLGA